MEISPHKFENETYKKLINSERLLKDAEHLMNSTYWIDQLKNNKATGIGNQLIYQLNESQQFVSDFIQFCVNVKKMCLKDHTKSSNCLNSLMNIDGPDSKTTLKLPIEFLVESSFLSLLDTVDFIGNIQHITSKITLWFPELKWMPKQQLNQIIENVLNTTPCFKRLMNSNQFLVEKKSMFVRRPIILGKRQYLWSINLNYLKYFVRYFFKCGEKYKNFTSDSDLFALDQFETPSFTLESNLIEFEIPASTSFLKDSLGKYNFNSSQVINLYQSWKSKLEQLKLLIQLKHNNYGFKWCEPILNNPNTKTIDFIKKDKLTRIDIKSKIINNRKQTIRNFKKHEPPVQTIVQLSNFDFNQSVSDQSINDFNLSTSESSFDTTSQNYTYFNLLSIPSLIIDPSTSGNANSVEHFLSNQDDDDDLRVVVTNDLSSITEHDKFIYF